MFGFKKKKNNGELENVSEESVNEVFGEDEELDENEEELDETEEELDETEEELDDSFFEDEESDFEEADISVEAELPGEPIDISVFSCVKTVNSLEELADFANSRGNGTMQFMSKKTLELFELRDFHFRLAAVWGSVTMARECSEEEYEKAQLALEVQANAEEYYLLPGLTEKEIKDAISDFCFESFEADGKKYANNPEKFTKFIVKNGCREEWNAYTKALVYDKLKSFCEKNGITFDAGGDGE